MAEVVLKAVRELAESIERDMSTLRCQKESSKDKDDISDYANKYAEIRAESKLLKHISYKLDELRHSTLVQAEWLLALKEGLLLWELEDKGIPSPEIERIADELDQNNEQRCNESPSKKLGIPFKKLGDRERIAWEVVDALDDVINEIKAELARHGFETAHPFPLEYLSLLANARGLLPVTSLERSVKRLPEEIREFFKPDSRLLEDVLNEKVAKRLKEQEKVRQLEELYHSLTWREVLNYYLGGDLSLEESKFWAKLNPDIRYCPECGANFTPDIYHSYQKYCSPRCANRVRQHRHRKLRAGGSQSCPVKRKVLK